ncbi:MAG: hypothetical protein KKA70_13070 [Proteobacteria bacterium]|nr:hypothetical protein [Pseudomonadota bacterium]
MGRLAIITAFWVCVFTCVNDPAFAMEDIGDTRWQPVNNGIRELEVSTVAINPKNPDQVYVGSAKAIYKTINAGEDWVEILSFRGTENSIHAVSLAPGNANHIYVGADQGLYASRDAGARWEKIYDGLAEQQKSVLSIAINAQDEDELLIGTRSGVYFSSNRGENWQRSRNLPHDICVFSIVFDPVEANNLFGATDKGIYKSVDSGVSWVRTYGMYSSKEETTVSNLLDQEGYDLDEMVFDENGSAYTGQDAEKSFFRGVVVDNSKERAVYVGTANGLLKSDNGGFEWKMMSGIGLTSPDIRHIVLSPDGSNLYAATDKGVFIYSRKKDKWDELYEGMIARDINFLATLSGNWNTNQILWAATGKGVFKAVPKVDYAESKKRQLTTREILNRFAQEPSIEEIRDAAIQYAEVSPDKINHWRKAAARKAWLPELRVAYDENEDFQTSTYFYSTSSEKYTDDDITEGTDSGWSVSLSWDLGDIIWSSDQTSIDTRSRLMVQLRDDVLNEVTRIYFERRRLQVQIMIDENMDINDRIEKELRLEELTANIDALTGSYLSRQLAVNKVRGVH